MLVKMLETRRVSPNGFDLLLLEKDKTYDLPHTTACFALKNFHCFNAEPFDDND